jgi:hypothetical protein
MYPCFRSAKGIAYLDSNPKWDSDPNLHSSKMLDPDLETLVCKLINRVLGIPIENNRLE